MKNIHLIPTDQPSRLYIDNKGNFVFGMMQTLIQTINNDSTNQNIYITSDEEIKEGDWYYLQAVSDIGSDSGTYRCEDKTTSKLNTLASNCKKVILTTDQDLIDDGVQEIDNEFLEWFVNNSNCEEIGVKKYENGKYWTYEIIIPTLEQELENIVSKQPSKFWEESDERVKERETSIEHHQELFNYLNNELNAIALQSQMFEIEAIVLKAQKEQMYSEEDMINFANLYSDIDINDSHLKYFNNLPRFKKEIR